MGTARLDITRDYAEVSIAVLPGWRNKGLGSAIVREITMLSHDSGCPHLRAVARTTNTGSLIAFLRSGYVPVDVWTEDGGDWIALDRVIGQ